MSQMTDTNCVSFPAHEAIPQYSLVTLENTGKVSINGLAELPIGVAMKEAYAADEEIPVKLLNGSGTFKVIAVEGLAIGATLYTEAAGKVQDTAAATSYPIGIAKEAATADGDIIEMIPIHYGGAAAQ